jgi:folate-dependent phosphoribosylglycinamide formyltransferase PurN
VQNRLEATGTDAAIDFVFSNREPGEAEGSDEFFQLVRGYGLPLITHSSTKFRRSRGGRFSDHRDEYDRQVMQLLVDRQPDICVLAGYMLIVGGEMCRAYPLLNLHPALPDGPTGTWQEVVWSLIENRATRTGAMMHLATEEVDRGPVVSYVTVPITAGAFDGHWSALGGEDLEQIKAAEGEGFPLFQLIRKEQYRREPYLVFETIRQLSLGSLSIRGGAVLDAVGKPLSETAPNGICLDRQIEESLALDAAGESG